MIINLSDISDEAFYGIARENILRGADIFYGDNLDYEIDKLRLDISNGRLLMLYSEAKNDLKIVESKLLKKIPLLDRGIVFYI